MAVDQFLKIDELGGESMDSKHKNTMDVLAWSWGASQGGSMHRAGGGGSGKADVQDLNVTKWYDKCSTELLKHCMNGEHFKEATLTVRKAGSKPLEYIVLKMKEVIITSVSMGGSGGEEQLTENVSLNFAKYELYYVEQTSTGGEGAKPDVKWDIKANEAM